MVTNFTKAELMELALEAGVALNDICVICGQPIKVMTFKHTGVCCEDHRKDRDDDHEPASGTLDARGKLIPRPAHRSNAERA